MGAGEGDARCWSSLPGRDAGDGVDGDEEGRGRAPCASGVRAQPNGYGRPMTSRGGDMGAADGPADREPAEKTTVDDGVAVDPLPSTGSLRWADDAGDPAESGRPPWWRRRPRRFRNTCCAGPATPTPASPRPLASPWDPPSGPPLENSWSGSRWPLGGAGLQNAVRTTVRRPRRRPGRFVERLLGVAVRSAAGRCPGPQRAGVPPARLVRPAAYWSAPRRRCPRPRPWWHYTGGSAARRSSSPPWA